MATFLNRFAVMVNHPLLARIIHQVIEHVIFPCDFVALVDFLQLVAERPLPPKSTMTA